MKRVARPTFFQRQENRLLVTLLLSVAYPIICAAMFTVFVFAILPVSSLNLSKPLLFIYWLSAAGGWLVLLVIFLPLMKDEHLDKILSGRQRESGINLKRVTLMDSNDLLKDDQEKMPRKSADDSHSDASFEELQCTVLAEKETLLESPYSESPYHRRPLTAGSPPRELIMDSSELLSDTEFSFSDTIVKVHAEPNDNHQIRSHSTEDLNKMKLLDPNYLANKNRKNLSNQNLRNISRENIKNISQDNLSRVKEDKINIADAYEETTLLDKHSSGSTEIVQSTISGRKFQIDIVKSQNVRQYSLPSPEPLSPNSTQNTVFIYVNKD